MSINTTLPQNQHPVPDLQDGEEIEVFAVPRNQLQDFLKNQVSQGDILDSRLAAWAAGFLMQNNGSL